MGRLSVEEVVTLIHNAGYRCERGYPGRRSPVIGIPAVAVNIQSEEAGSTTMAVYVFCPVEDGAQCCEDLALAIGTLLREHGAVCTQDHCTHDGRGDRFSVRILAKWTDDAAEYPCTVHMGGWKRAYVTGVTTRLDTELTEVGAMGQDEPVAVLRREQGWLVTLTERFPVGTAEPGDPTEPFTILLRRGAVGESYQSCYWKSIQREDTAQGLLVTRVARAGKRSLVNYG